MRRKDKQELLNIVDGLQTAHKEIMSAIREKQNTLAKNMLGECQEYAINVGSIIEKLEGNETTTVSLLEKYCEELYFLHEDLQKDINKSNTSQKAVAVLNDKLNDVRNSIERDIVGKREVVFFPYKASMWDSLESVYLTAKEDPECDAYCVPIPYYDLKSDRSFGEIHYEGLEYPKNIECIDYRTYKFEERRPDAIYIHNPYDNWNLVTSVPPRFYSSNLKKYTEELVYIPYFVLQEIEPEDQSVIDGMKHFVWLPGVVNADKVIVQSEKMKQIYVNEYLKAATKNHADTIHQNRQYLERKILGLGSPKIDKVINTRKEDLKIPEDWLKIIEKPDGSRKKIIFYNTGIAALLQYGQQWVDKIEDVLKIFKDNKDDVALLWRPHPLIENTMKSMRPEVMQKYLEIKQNYLNEGWGIYDDTSDMDRAVILSNGYYGDTSSVVQVYEQTGKQILIADYDVFSAQYTNVLSTYQYICCNNKIFFYAKNCNGLYMYDKESRQTTLIQTNITNDACSDFLYGGMEYYDEKLILAPYFDNHIQIISTTNHYRCEHINVDKSCAAAKQEIRYLKKIILMDNKLFFIGDVYSEILSLNIDTNDIEIVNFWKDEVKKYFNQKEFIGINTHRDVCIFEDGIIVPLSHKNCIIQINFKLQKAQIYEIKEANMIFSTICYDGQDFWLAGNERRIVKWNRESDTTTIIDTFPTQFDVFYKEKYWRDLFSYCFHVEQYIYFFPMTSNMIVRINRCTLKMEPIRINTKLKSCFSVDKWSDREFYIETGDRKFEMINESMIIDLDGNIMGKNVFQIKAGDIGRAIKYHNKMIKETTILSLKSVLIETN